MKKYSIIILLVSAILCLFMLAGCGKKTDDTDIQDGTKVPTSTALNTEITTDGADTQSTQQSTTDVQTEDTDPSYTKEENELEIITPNADSTQGSTMAPEPTENAQTEETFPGLDSVIDEPIELPFVPIN